MQAKPTGWAALFAAPHRTEYKFVIDGVTYTAADIPSTPVISKAFADKLGIGYCSSGTLQLSIWAKTVIPKAATVVAYCRLISPDGATATAWIEQGHYLISSRSVKNGITTLTCRDAMQKARTIYWDKTQITSWSAPMADVVADIASFMGVSIDSRTTIKSGDAYKVQVPNSDTTMLDVLASIAAAHGGNFVITEKGKLRLIPIASPTAVPNQTIGGAHRGFARLAVGKTIKKVLLDCGDDSAYEAGTDDGAEISGDCLYASQALADALGGTSGSLYGVTVDAYSMSGAYLDPCIELGDTVRVADGTTNRSVIVASANIRCTSSYNADLAYQVDIGDEDEYPYIGATERTERRIRSAVTKSELNAAFSTYVNSDTGKAEMTAALIGTFANKSDLDGLVKKTELNADIGAYIDTAEGTAKIVSNLSGTFLKDADLSDFVKKTELSTEIGAYIDTKAGQAKIISAVSGTYQTKDGMSDYATVDALTDITQSISQIESKISLSASYDDNSIGSNVRALLELVANPNSSEIQIKADKINFDGFTTFVRESDLSESGKTTIDGGNITTGTISAERIDASELKIDRIYSSANSGSYPAIDCSSNVIMYIGGNDKDDILHYSFIYMLTETLTVRHWNDDSQFCVATGAGGKYICGKSDWDLGTSTYPFKNAYIKNSIIFGTSSTLDFSLSGKILPGNTDHTDLGSSSRYWDGVYAKEMVLCSDTVTRIALSCNASGKLTVGGAVFDPSSSASTSQLKNGSYSVDLTSTPALLPASSDSYSLGSSSRFWSDAYIKSLRICYSSTTSITLACNVSGKLTIGGTEYSGGSSNALKSGDYMVSLSSKVLTPGSSDAYDLGTSSVFWANAYIKSLKICYSSTRSVALACDSSGKLTVGGSTIEAFSPGSSPSIIPSSNDLYNLGSSSKYWDVAYVSSLQLCYSTSRSVALACNSNGQLTVGGSVLSSFSPGSSPSLIPSSKETYDLGSTSYFWKYLYVKTIRLYYNSYTYVDLACNSSSKLTSGGKVVTTA